MLPTNVGTGLVVGQFGLGVADGSDPDREPELIPVSGRIIFTPSVTYLPNVTADPNPITIISGPIVAVLDADGYVCTPGDDGVSPMYRGIRLFATNDPDMSVENWTWSVVYQFDPINGFAPKLPAHAMALLEGEEIDLTKVVPVPSSPGIGTPQALALLAAAEAAAGTVADARLLMERAEDAADRAEAPTDQMMANTASNPSSQFSGVLDGVIESKTPDAIQQVMGPVVDGLVSQSIASDPTVANAAAAAVDANPKIATLEQKNVTQDTAITAAKTDAIADATAKYGGLPQRVSALDSAPLKSSTASYGGEITVAEVDESGKVSRFIDEKGRTWIQPHPDTPGLVDSGVAQQLQPIPEGPDWVYALTDESDAIGFGLGRDGSASFAGGQYTPMPAGGDWEFVLTDENNAIGFGLRFDGSTTLGGAATTTPGYDLIIAVGQSNQSGAGMPMSEETSPTHPRVFQFPSITKPQYGQIIPAVEPLLSYGPIVGVTGTGPTMEFARMWADAHPDRKVLIVIGAKSGSGFTPTAGLSWQLNTTEPEPVGRIAIQQAKDALIAAGEGSRLVALTWVQGEADGAMGGPTYQGYLDELFTDGFRAELGADLPIIVGQMNPDRTDTLASARVIDKVHMDTPRRLLRSAFAYGPRGAHNDDGLTHYSSRGTVLLGRSMFEAYQRAVRNDGTTGAAQVENLRVERSFDKATVSWDQPYSTVTGYTIEWSTDGTTWSTADVAQYYDLDPKATVTNSSPVTFRITVHNNAADSRPQTITG